ncbi:hypothetical protein E2562_009756, partial [Oryza meyeriana var. granulata]
KSDLVPEQVEDFEQGWASKRVQYNGAAPHRKTNVGYRRVLNNLGCSILASIILYG